MLFQTRVMPYNTGCGVEKSIDPSMDAVSPYFNRSMFVTDTRKQHIPHDQRSCGKNQQSK